MTRSGFSTNNLLSAMPLLICLLATTSALGQGIVFYPANATIDYDIGYNDAWIGYSNYADYTTGTNRTSPTVNFLPGSNIGDDLESFNSSIVTFGGENIRYGFVSEDNSTMTIMRGTLNGGGGSYGTSTLNISGGTMQELASSQNSTMNVTGGDISVQVEAFDSSITNISGGSIGTIIASTGGTINLTGGTTASNIFYDEAANFNFFGSGLSAVLNGSLSTQYVQYYDLFGRLQDGTDISGKQLYVSNGGRFSIQNTNVPEPGPIGIYLTALIAGCLSRRLHRLRS